LCHERCYQMNPAWSPYGLPAEELAGLLETLDSSSYCRPMSWPVPPGPGRSRLTSTDAQ